MQAGETPLDDRAHEIEGERSALVAAPQTLRVRLALRGREAGAVDVVAPVRGQRQAVPGFGISGARLGILPGEPPDTNDRLLQSLQQHQAHLQEDLQALGDVVGLAVREALRTIAALKQELLAALRAREPRPQGLDLPGDHERRQAAQGSDYPLERDRIGVLRLLSRRTPLPARRVPVRQLWGLGHDPGCYTARARRAKPAPGRRGGASRAGTAECGPHASTEVLYVQSPRNARSPRAR